MTAIKYINRLKYLDYLVRSHATGNPANLASKMGVSVRSTYDYINDLKELGAPVKWSVHEDSYVYAEEGKLELCFISETYGGMTVIHKSFSENNLIFSENFSPLQRYCSEAI
jgi:predicted DNA-binding transcriptional regulator YafY